MEITLLSDGAHLIPMGTRGLRKCYVIDAVAYQIAKCGRCFRDVAFVPTPAGKRQPRDADGQVHFVTCPFELQKRGQRHYVPPGQLRLF